MQRLSRIVDGTTVGRGSQRGGRSKNSLDTCFFAEDANAAIGFPVSPGNTPTLNRLPLDAKVA